MAKALCASARSGASSKALVAASLACGIVSIVNALDPEVVVIGGGIANAGSVLFEPLGEHVDRLEWRPTDEGVRIVQAELGEWAGAVGAARHALTCAEGHRVEGNCAEGN